MSFPVAPPVQNFVAQTQNCEVLLTWDIVASAQSYEIQKSTDNLNWSSLITQQTLSYVDGDVTEGLTYYYQVRAASLGGPGPWSASASAVPSFSGKLSLSQLRQQSKQRADRENSSFITDAEWNTYINQSYYELYDLLTTVDEEYNVAAPLQIETDGSTSQYPLPDGTLYQNAPPFFKLKGVDMGVAGNNNAWVTVHKFNFISRNRYVYPNITSSFLGVFNLRYRVVGNTLMFIPAPSGGQFIRIWYAPRMQALLQDQDLCDGVDGWTEYIITDAAIKALQKEESDVSVLMAQKQALIDRINSTAMNRDQGMPDTVSDTRSRGDQWGSFGGPNGDGAFGGY